MGALIGKKLGMTQMYDEKEDLIPVTVVVAGPCPVVAIRNEEDNGYAALQLAFDAIPERKLSKPERTKIISLITIDVHGRDMIEKFIDRNADGRPDGGYAGLENLIDGVETANYSPGHILDKAPFHIRRRSGREQLRQNWEFIWLQLLNRGRTIHICWNK